VIQKEWPVLIVDDEPDGLAVTRLALKDVQVDGVPFKLHSATSKAEAIQLFTEAPGPPVAPYFDVALIDKVLTALAKAGAETPQARAAV
jgi:CheY-like chemotaxis protein